MSVSDLVILTERRIHRLELVEVDAVVDDFDRMVLPEQGYPDQIGEPFRRRDQGHRLHAVVEFLSFQPDLSRIVQEQGGVIVIQPGTAAAALLPFLAAELRASSGEGPVVVQRPDTGDVIVPDVGEQHLDVEIVVAERMDVDQVGIDLLQFVDEEFRVDDVEAAVEAEDVGKTLGDDPVDLCPDVDLVLVPVLEAGTALAAAGVDLEAFFPGFPGDVQHDVAGAGIVVVVDFDDRFHR